MKRLLKVLTGHSSAIDSLERKLREISAPKKKKRTNVKQITNGPQQNGVAPGDLANQLSTYQKQQQYGAAYSNNQPIDEDDLDGDDEGMPDELDTPTPPEQQDEIDILSEGAMEREIMMDQIQMVEINQMENYKNYTLQVDNTVDLKINDSDELDSVSSEDSDVDLDKEDEEAN